jgi:hypothetical protein
MMNRRSAEPSISFKRWLLDTPEALAAGIGCALCFIATVIVDHLQHVAIREPDGRTCQRAGLNRGDVNKIAMIDEYHKRIAMATSEARRNEIVLARERPRWRGVPIMQQPQLYILLRRGSA